VSIQAAAVETAGRRPKWRRRSPEILPKRNWCPTTHDDPTVLIAEPVGHHLDEAGLAGCLTHPIETSKGATLLRCEDHHDTAADNNQQARADDSLWANSVPGFGFILENRRALESSKGHARTLSLDLYDQWASMEANGHFRFTPPIHTILAFEQALNELDEEGGVCAAENAIDKTTLHCAAA
jgi:hypothetical protein